MTIGLRRGIEDEYLSFKGFFLPIEKPVDLMEAKWIIKIVLALKPVMIFKFYINKSEMGQPPWSTESINVLSLEK